MNDCGVTCHSGFVLGGTQCLNTLPCDIAIYDIFQSQLAAYDKLLWISMGFLLLHVRFLFKSFHEIQNFFRS